MEKLYGLVFLFSILMLTNQAPAKNNDLSNGIWFICEFAHSQIPPEDDRQRPPRVRSRQGKNILCGQGMSEDLVSRINNFLRMLVH